MKTIFLDIDGTIIAQPNDQNNFAAIAQNVCQPQMLALKDCTAKCMEWHLKGYRVILTTGRPSVVREACIKQLAECGIVYDQLIMDLGNSPRYLINNYGDDGEAKAFAINVETNAGISEVDLDEMS